MSRAKLTPSARRDLSRIADYIAAEASVERSKQVLSVIQSDLKKLSSMPGMGHFREELLDRNYKFWAVYSYVIVYRWQQDPIDVIAILHGAREMVTVLNARASL